MKARSVFFIVMLLFVSGLFGQTIPKLYINFVSHNEPDDNLQQPLNFNKSIVWVQQFADLMDAQGAAWNLETCNGFVNGALSIQNAGTLHNDILETLANPPYDDNIEIDPRNKNLPGTNIADLWYLLDSCGANPSHNLGGFIYASTQTIQPDWFQYEDTVWAMTFPNVPWKCNIIWGAGSLPPHDNDLNDYGTWKPDSVNTFYTHNPARTVWYQGNGCQPINALDSLEDEQIVISQIKGAVDSIQNGMWPSDRFYCYTVTINQSQFGPMLLAKVANVIDSVNAMDSSKIAWATITQKFLAFQNWQNTPNDASQWNCGDVLSSTAEPTENESIPFFPNPFGSVLRFDAHDDRMHKIEVTNALGQTLISTEAIGSRTWDTFKWQAGIYLVRVDQSKALRLIKQ